LAGEPEIRRPIAFDFEDRGRLWVTENYFHSVWKADEGVDRIVILEDPNHDGEFDERRTFWTKRPVLTGITIGHGACGSQTRPSCYSFQIETAMTSFQTRDLSLNSTVFRSPTINVLNNFHWDPDECDRPSDEVVSRKT